VRRDCPICKSQHWVNIKQGAQECASLANAAVTPQVLECIDRNEERLSLTNALCGCQYFRQILAGVARFGRSDYSQTETE
jgi:hypothetical protein